MREEAGRGHTSDLRGRNRGPVSDLWFMSATLEPEYGNSPTNFPSQSEVNRHFA